MNNDPIEIGETIAFVLIALSILISFVWKLFTSSASNTLRKRREQVLEGLGFTIAHYPRFQARLEGQPVQIELGDNETRLIAGWPPRSGLLLARGPSNDPIGDPAFDRAVDTRGASVQALAWLSASQRESLAKAIANGWELTSRGLERLGRWDDAEELSALLEEGLRTAKALPRRRQSLLEGLVERLSQDPIVGVRRRALAEVVKRANADDEELAQAVVLCRADPDPELRMFAARRDSDPVLLAGLALSAQAAPTLRAEALALLLTRCPGHLATHDLLNRLLLQVEGKPAPGLDTDAAIAMVGALGPHLEVPETRAAASPRTVVMTALQGPAPLALTAIDTLATHAGLWAVPHLLPLRDKKLPDAAKAAATRAIAFIQARAGGDAGGLSLSQEGGALALSERYVE